MNNVNNELDGIIDTNDPLRERELTDTKESIAGRLRKQRQAAAENKFHDIDIPGYNGELFCRYRILGGEEVDAIVKKVRQETNNRSEQVLASTLDNIITACDEFWLRDEGKEIPLKKHPDVDSELPVRYDATLAEFLQFSDELPDPPTARSVVLGLFVGNDLAVSAHGAILVQWMMSGGVELDMMLGGR